MVRETVESVKEQMSEKETQPKQSVQVEMKDLVVQIRESHSLNKSNFAVLLGVDRATVTRWENGERAPTGQKEIGALLRVAEPEQQRALLEALGIEDVEQFAADLLASAGVVLIEKEAQE